MKNQLFSNTEKEKIEAAIQVAEKKTNGEIVVHVSKQSVSYLIGAFLCSLSLGITSLILETISNLYLTNEVSGFEKLFSVGIFIVGFVLAYFVPNVCIIFVPQNEIYKRVIQKAQLIFLEKELFKTKDRTGLLIFISQLERKVEVLGDTGINNQIAPAQWENIVNEITLGIKNKNASDGIIKGISLASELLVSSNFHIKPDDENELPNTISFD